MIDPIADALLAALPRCTFTKTCTRAATRGYKRYPSVRYCDFHWDCVVSLYDKGLGATEVMGPIPTDLPQAAAVRAAMAAKGEP